MTTLPGFADRSFASGLEIVCVAKAGHIGDYIRLRVSGHKLATSHRYMAPGSSAPKRACP